MKFRKKPLVIDAVQYNGDYAPIRQFAGESFVVTTTQIGIHTLEGFMTISLGDYIIKGIEDEFYPCKKAIFEASYEPIEDTLSVHGIDSSVIAFAETVLLQQQKAKIEKLEHRVSELQKTLELIGSCSSTYSGDVVDIAQKAIAYIERTA